MFQVEIYDSLTVVTILNLMSGFVKILKLGYLKQKIHTANYMI